VPGAIIAVSRPDYDEACQHDVLQKYCLSCHIEAMKRRGAVPTSLDQRDLTGVANDAEIWERVIRM
jgi:hypothetical protein